MLYWEEGVWVNLEEGYDIFWKDLRIGHRISGRFLWIFPLFQEQASLTKALNVTISVAYRQRKLINVTWLKDVFGKNSV